MRLLTPVCGLLLLAVTAGGCERHSVSRKCPHDAGMKTCLQRTNSVNFPYAAPQLRRERIVKNFDRVGVGSTRDEVVATFGEPDYEHELYPKDSNRSCAYEFLYCFEKPGDMENEIRDKKMGVFFSVSGKPLGLLQTSPVSAEKVVRQPKTYDDHALAWLTPLPETDSPKFVNRKVFKTSNY
jgi:hypothetical protein